MLTIKQRQMNLNFLNYSTGGIDGKEGIKTKSAYKSFQRDFGLIADGIYGNATNSKLIEVIENIQRELGTNVDGVVGVNTIEKCKEFQRANGLVVDGICGPATRNKLNDGSLSWDNIPHFKKSEMTCKCGCGLNNTDLRLMQVLENIRSHFGNRPIIITSGCRCYRHNKEVGGVEGSRHVLGKAVDFYISNVRVEDNLNYCQWLVSQGVLRYTYTNNKNMKGVVHIDIN